MIDYIKQNHLGLVIILWLVISSIVGGTGAVNRDTSNITNPFNFQQGMTSTSGTFSTTLDVAGATTLDELTQGGLVLATSTDATSMTFIAADLLTYSVWEVTPNTGDLTYTFPATSTMSAIVPTAGDSRTWIIYNATTTAAIDVIFAAGTGSEIKGVGGAALTIDESSFGTIMLIRKADSDILILTNFPTAD